MKADRSRAFKSAQPRRERSPESRFVSMPQRESHLWSRAFVGAPEGAGQSLADGLCASSEKPIWRSAFPGGHRIQVAATGNNSLLAVVRRVPRSAVRGSLLPWVTFRCEAAGKSNGLVATAP